jgi:hypothetical protein
MTRCRAASLLLAVTLATAPAFAAAQTQSGHAPGRTDAVSQTVRGVLAESGTNTPVAGAIVTLRSESGDEAGRTLTDGEGRYLLIVQRPGRYTLVAERIGYERSETSSFEVAAGASVVRNLVASTAAIVLPRIEVVVAARCVGRASESAETHALWEEARKALAAVELTTQLRAVTFRTVRFARDLEPHTRRVESQTVSPVTVRSVPPFFSRPAAELMRDGFVRVKGDSISYFGPDAQVLLSDAFHAGHCFGVRRRGGERAGLIGLTFAPTPERRGSYGVQGTLWLDDATGELSHLEFNWTRLPFSARLADFGGRVDFRRLESGAWIVSEWVLRMPRQRVAVRHRGVGLEIALREEGGEVAAIEERGRSTTLAQLAGTVVGRVLDRESDAPVGGALVFLDGTQHASPTAEDGTFQITGVRPGLYELRAYHPELDPEAEFMEHAAVAVAADAERYLDIRIAGIAERLARSCPEGGDVSAVVGMVRDRLTGVALADARVRLQVAGSSPEVQLRTDARGFYVACGVEPAGVRGLSAEFAGFRSRPQTPADAGSRLLRHDLEIDVTSTARVLGRVLDAETGQPVSAALVSLEGAPRGVLTNARGEFTMRDVPPGDQAITVQHIAYGEQRALVQLRGGTEAHATLRLSQRAVALEGITVRAERSPIHADFHRRMRQALGGTFIGREELERYQNRTVADAIVRLGGAFLGGGGRGLGGFVVLRRHEGPSCQPAVFIDGVQIRANPMELLFEMHPGSVEGIEVYQGAATVPGEFGGSSAQCGVIAVWTRRG